MNKMKRKELVRLSRNNLDDAAEEQAERYLDAADTQAEVGRRKEKLEKRIKDFEADLAGKYRKQPMKYLGTDKISVQDKAIQERISRHKTIRRLRDELIDIRHEFNMAANLVNALDQRRSGIKYLQELWKGEYWGLEHNADPLEEADLRLRKQKRRNKNNE